ncbi:MAG: hypothetical protein CL693_20390 [Cellvibrionaceae bacterium]|nr:hypothetical protein [Cellvibrionaceae bacterium]|tara:strand:- start:9196 stop:9693 length:498 start_codon:yes stop_codon:yes gene_type:complete
MQPKYIIDDTEYLVTPIRRTDSIVLDINGHTQDVRLKWHDEHYGEITIAGKPSQFYAAQDEDRLYIHIDGKVWEVNIADEFGATQDDGNSSGNVTAPMPGVVIEVAVNQGDSVNQGDTVMLIESMKLQTEIKASVTGTVTSIGSEAGASFNKGAVLVSITAEEQS